MVIQNLEAAGCPTDMMEKFMGSFEAGNVKAQLMLLKIQRARLLDRIHADEQRISRLDYLVYQIESRM